MLDFLVSEPWLINGLYDYYLQTNSIRAIEILVNVREPLHIQLCERYVRLLNSNYTNEFFFCTLIIADEGISTAHWPV